MYSIHVGGGGTEECIDVGLSISKSHDLVQEHAWGTCRRPAYRPDTRLEVRDRRLLSRRAGVPDGLLALAGAAVGALRLLAAGGVDWGMAISSCQYWVNDPLSDIALHRRHVAMSFPENKQREKHAFAF
jgi:hypothetical protein